MWNLEKIENCQISIFLYIIFFFVNYNPYSGLVIIDNDLLLLWSESSVSEAVFAGLTQSVS